MKKLLLFIVTLSLSFNVFSQTTYTVNTTDDLPDININDGICADANGNCTLRAAIQNANRTNAKDIIAFNISGTGPFVIAVNQTYGVIQPIEKPVILDGRTQPGYTNAPLIELDGSGLEGAYQGLQLIGTSTGSEVYGMSIGGFKRLEVMPFAYGDGVYANTGNHIFQSNYLGIKPDGVTVNPNTGSGMWFNNTGNNLIGGTEPNQGNLISGNLGVGLNFTGTATNSAATNNIVQGNLIGTDVTGTLARGNLFNVQFIDAPNNTLGGNSAGARNIISGAVMLESQSGGSGLVLNGTEAYGNKIIGNYIGTDISGTQAIPNMRGGILMLFGANNNEIGTDQPGEGNIISGNDLFGGIYLQGSETKHVESNSFKGNYIGVDVTGSVAIPNYRGFLFNSFNNNNNIIGGTTAGSRNIISGNTADGINISNGTGNQIIGNYVGTDVLGTTAIANGYGIYIKDSNNSIGGQAAGSRNIISGNGTGIYLALSTSNGCSVKGNYIGLNALGNDALPNDTGIRLSSTTSNIAIGGPAVTDRNIISGNFDKGILVSGTDHIIQNNYVGLNPAGDGIIKNTNYGLQLDAVLTNTLVSENIISGNGTVSSTGRNVFFFGASGARFIKNKVGTLPDGITGVTNPGPGILMVNSSSNIIGGDDESQGNIIAGNSFKGINLILACNNNIIDNNKIGVGADGTTSIGNAVAGIDMSGTMSGNVIAHNIIANSPIGVRLDPASGIPTQITITENSIYNNTILGIDLVGATTNDVGDADAGVNNLQNTPEISAVVDLGDDALDVTYSVSSTVTNSAYPMVIEFFAAVNGQGKIFIESDVYAAPGNKTMTLNLPTGFDPNDYVNIVATATDANGNTSEFGISTETTLSIAQLENHSFKVYPNPVSDQLFIQLSTSGSYNLEVINVLGQLVLTKKDHASSTTLDVSNLKNGIYFLNIHYSNESSQTIKFIKN